MINNVAKVVSLFKEGGLSCSEAMLSVYGKSFGLDEETSIKLASAFSAGMGRMAKTCGAVTGAFLVLGLTYQINNPQSKDQVFSLVEEFTKQFRSRNGSLSCKELLGYDFSTAEGMKEIKEKKLTSTICPKFVQDAAEITAVLLFERESGNTGS